ncbi:class I SAM-dependent methyltransferase [Tautonia plasticadhaerens]|uniref:Bifunctional 3-demethylubiquinone-9 3-methyltransferase/ 2-octaprenyl-6-hydroxy phenol methylase n=1 Tax=Tautonia plasticadhaerens TaxID=2527974 RepID=A0A518GZA3_9BACT|nr:class I SAM-dependent methyltransferase [Tautonia plasticadhaerens]QDV33924.1 bifunctional 3-demethylubiquinone-9 3-methyltransferase/ 2-octaprenyl-6-hydroxy phenol methylase [Tautonia plasticadhaerens]
MAGIGPAPHAFGPAARSGRTSPGLATRLRLTLKYWLWPGINWVSRDKAAVVKMLQHGTPEAPVRTLDCGCGNAYFAFEAARRGASCLGITIHDWERRSCEEMAEFLGPIGEAMEFRVQRLDDLARDPGAVGSFDQILLFDVIEHIRDDRAALLQLRELLNDDGLVYISTPDRDYQGNADHLRVTRTEDGWHVRNGYTLGQLERLVEECGLEPVDHLRFGTLGTTLVTRIQHKVFRSAILPLTVLTFPLLKLIAWLGSPWADRHTIFVLARKRADAELAARR